MEEAIQARLQEAETACNGLEADQSKLQQKIEEIEKENSKTYEELKKLKAELADSEEQYHNLQKRILGDQRQDLFHRPLVEASARRNTLLSSASPMKAPSHRHGLGSFPESFPKQPQQQHQQPQYQRQQQQQQQQQQQHRLHQPVDFGFNSSMSFRDVCRQESTSGGGTSHEPRNSSNTGLVEHMSSKRKPMFTPGMFGAGRVTKKRMS